MARADLLHKLYSKNRGAESFNYDALVAPPLLSLLSYYDLQLLDQISLDPKIANNVLKKLEAADQILQCRGFKRLTQGTNRAVYKFLEDQSFVLKLAISEPGRNDSAQEMSNQNKLKPFVAKCFDVYPTGSIGIFERVEDITSKEQFKYIAQDVFNLLNDHIIGEYVMADIGTNFFRNYGIRLGFGPVILDYPMLYELDGAKLYCNAMDLSGHVCDGSIDYDAGFNFLFCEKCGCQYFAKQLAKKIDTGEIIIPNRRKVRMKILFKEGDEVIDTYQNDITSSDAYVRKSLNKNNKRHNNQKKEKVLEVKESTVDEESNNIIEGDTIAKSVMMSENSSNSERIDESINSVIESSDENVEVSETVEEADQQDEYEEEEDMNEEIKEEVVEETVEEEAEQQNFEEEEEDIPTEIDTSDEYINQQVENMRNFLDTIDGHIKAGDYSSVSGYAHLIKTTMVNLEESSNARAIEIANGSSSNEETLEKVEENIPLNLNTEANDIQSPEELAKKMANY